MIKKGITGSTYSINFRKVVVGLGILITVLLLPWMREGFAFVFLENNFFGTFFPENP